MFRTIVKSDNIRITDAIQSLESNIAVDVQFSFINHDNLTSSLTDTCGQLKQQSWTLVVDMSWGGWDKLRTAVEANGVPYLRVETAKHLFVQAMDEFLSARDAIDAALIYENEPEIDESLYWIIGNSYIRIMVLQLDRQDTLTRIANIRPAPSFYIVYGDTATVQGFINDAGPRKLIKRDSRWNFVLTDWSEGVSLDNIDTLVTKMTMTPDSCCVVLNKKSNCQCSSYSSPIQPFVSQAMLLLTRALVQMKTSGSTLLANLDCNTTETPSPDLVNSFDSALKFYVSQSTYDYNSETKLLTFPVEFNFHSSNKEKSVQVGKWNMQDKFRYHPSYNATELKRFFSIGTVTRTPWTFQEENDGKMVTDKDGGPVLLGYCIDMIGKMAQEMSFDYEVLLPSDGSNDFGRRNEDTGEWSGLIGDLISGRVDIVVAPMTMTSEREEVIDFVAPYFDQSGISIINRKPVVQRHLFKFLKVLKTEVWLAILAALTVTAIMIWLLDK